jgi:hypothetical protein
MNWKRREISPKNLTDLGDTLRTIIKEFKNEKVNRPEK